MVFDASGKGDGDAMKASQLDERYVKIDENVKVNAIALLEETLEWKRKYYSLEMKHNEVKQKVLALAKVLGKDSPAASKLWEELKAWAAKKP